MMILTSVLKRMMILTSVLKEVFISKMMLNDSLKIQEDGISMIAIVKKYLLNILKINND